MLYLRITQWKTRPVHFYGTIRDETGAIVQEIFQCATRKGVINIAKKWAQGRKLVVRKKTEFF